MQIAAANPLYVRREEVPAEAVEKEKEILKAQALNEGKPEKIVEKMVEGRISKFYEEYCLLEQSFVKDPDKTISQLLNEKSAPLAKTSPSVVLFVLNWAKAWKRKSTTLLKK